jgi:predicted nucleic acid-binding protein
VTGLTYDTAALVAADRGDRRAWVLHRRALERGITPSVPAAALAEAWRGGALLARFLAGAEVEPLDPERARAAGLLLGRCSREVGAVDATVVESALRRRSAVVTGDRADLEALAEGAGRRLAVIDL